MAVMPMKRVQILALKKDRKKVLELLQRIGTVEINYDLPQDDVFTKTDMSASSAQFMKHSEAADSALGILDRVSPENKGMLSSLEGRKEIALPEYDMYVKQHKDIAAEAYKIIGLDKREAELKAEIPKLEMERTSLEPWKTFDLPLDYSGTKKTDVIAGTLPGEETMETLLMKIGEADPSLTDFDAQIISHTQIQTCVFFICKKDSTPKLQEALRTMGFAKAPLSSRTPALQMKRIEEDISAAGQEMKDIEHSIAAFAPDRGKLKFIRDYYIMRADKYNVISDLSQSHRTFVLEGYLPEEDTAELEKKLEPFDLALEFTEPGPDEDVPVKLKNNNYAAPVESVVESYSMPARGEMDPSAIMAGFYYICYGLMLSDAAYGMIMAGATAYCLKKYPKMEEGTRKFLKMFFYCGLSTIFWGFMFGSFFGDAVNVIATTFFNRPDIKLPALWFEPVNKPMKMLVFSFVVGIVHLFTGLGIKFYSEWKAGNKLDAIYDAGFWYLFVGGGIVYLLTMKMFTDMLGLSFTLPAAAGSAAAAAAAVGCVGVILTGGRESRNWFKRILKGLYAAYGITGYLSDILSYSRLLALGLATSVISTVFNKMGSMLGGSLIGGIVFILVFVVGHLMNVAINALGAYVHTNRLQYVEFFGKFYQGGGRKINPFGEKTKYYKIMEAN